MRHWLYLGGGGLLIVMALIALVMNMTVLSHKIDYDTATEAERVEWLTRESIPLVKDFNEGLRMGGAKVTQINVTDTEISAERREIKLIVEVKSNTVMIFPPDFRMKLLGRMCRPYRRSGFEPNDIKTTFKLIRTNGDPIRSDTVSRTVCERMRAQKKRMRS